MRTSSVIKQQVLTIASMAAYSGVTMAIIVFGHTDIRTTQKYSHVDVLSQSEVFAAQSGIYRGKIGRSRRIK